ncbi:MAG TPA: tyrosine recombinase XerC, partial [Mizugakiibacter sp.]|nr:tyrosine recombinase XerC [Mizugakiibacter sp.]
MKSSLFPNLNKAIEDFLEHLRVERRYAPRTMDNYRRELGLLARHLHLSGVHSWPEARSEHIQALIAAEHRRGRGPASLRLLLSASRSLFRYLLREGQIQANPAQPVRAPKLPRRLPYVLDVDEAKVLVELKARDALQPRDQAILELLYSSGLRVSELVGLYWRDLDIQQGLVRITGKGSKIRLVPVGRAALQALQALPYADSETPIFPGRGGRPLSTAAVRLRLQRRALEQGLGKRVHPHLLRHT